MVILFAIDYSYLIRWFIIQQYYQTLSYKKSMDQNKFISYYTFKITMKDILFLGYGTITTS